jgi:hypothetical protein
MSKPEYIECDCGGELIQLYYDKKNYPFLDMTFYSVGKDKNAKYFSFWQKLRHIWQIIKYGHPFSDGVVLNQDSAIQLKNHLNSYIRQCRLEENK